MIEYSLEYAQQRARDFQAEAAQHALAASAEQTPRLPFYAPLLAEAGRQMEALGDRLQRRYTECSEHRERSALTPRREMTQWN